jgi:hypothetical protein
MVLAGPSAASDREDERHVGWVDLLCVRGAHGPGQSALGECLPERARQTIAGVSQHAAKTHTSAAHAVYLGQGDLGLRAGPTRLFRNLGAIHTRQIAGTALGEEQPKPDHDWHLARCQRHRYKGLTVGRLA